MARTAPSWLSRCSWTYSGCPEKDSRHSSSSALTDAPDHVKERSGKVGQHIFILVSNAPVEASAIMLAFHRAHADARASGPVAALRRRARFSTLSVFSSVMASLIPMCLQLTTMTMANGTTLALYDPVLATRAPNCIDSHLASCLVDVQCEHLLTAAKLFRNHRAAFRILCGELLPGYRVRGCLYHEIVMPHEGQPGFWILGMSIMECNQRISRIRHARCVETGCTL